MGCQSMKGRFTKIVGECEGEGEGLRLGGNIEGIKTNEYHIHMNKSCECERLLIEEGKIIVDFVMLLFISFFIQKNVGKRKQKQVRLSFNRK